MSEETPNSQEPTNKANDKIQAAKENAKKVASAIMNKADDLYNKLPLDKINEKLKGKVDVKSSKFKKILGVAICCLLFLGIAMYCSSDGSKIIIPKFAYTYSPEYVKYRVKEIEAGLFPAQCAFFDATEAVGKRTTYRDLVGKDAREIFSVDYVTKTYGKEAAVKFDEVLKSKTKEEWEKEKDLNLMIVQDFGREVSFILEHIVDEANRELARRENSNTIKAVKYVQRDSGANHVESIWEDNWKGEFIVTDWEGREFDNVFFSCNVCFDMTKTNRSKKQLCGNAPLSLNLIWFGTNQMNDNWMSSGY